MLKLIFAVSAALALGACAQTPLPSYLAAPADPWAPVRATRYASVAGSTRSFRPVEPKGWEELNKGVTPKGELGGMNHAP